MLRVLLVLPLILMITFCSSHPRIQSGQQNILLPVKQNDSFRIGKTEVWVNFMLGGVPTFHFSTEIISPDSSNYSGSMKIQTVAILQNDIVLYKVIPIVGRTAYDGDPITQMIHSPGDLRFDSGINLEQTVCLILELSEPEKYYIRISDLIINKVY